MRRAMVTSGIMLASLGSSMSARTYSILYASDAHQFAAQELRRYTYLLTNRSAPLLEVKHVNGADDLAKEVSASDFSIVLVAADKPSHVDMVKKVLGAGSETTAHLDRITNSTTWAFSATADLTANVALVSSSNTVNLQHAVYSVLERWGARFSLHQDVLPDYSSCSVAQSGGEVAKCEAAPTFPDLVASLSTAADDGNEEAAAVSSDEPQFAYRGLQPFHDFPEGPDWWNLNHYRHVITQLSKQKMNFLGLHTYPYKQGVPTTGSDEPTVWVGTEDCLNDDGTVKATASCAYATSYANTMRNEWGYVALPTSNYSWGSDKLFDADCWGSYPGFETTCPAPPDAAAAASLFEATASMLEGAFSFGASFGVEGCVGTETPLSYDLPPPPTCTVDPSPGVCLRDPDQHAFPATVTIHDDVNTQEWCAGQCALLNHSLAAVEYSVACFCGEPADVQAATKLPRSSCSAMSCAGNSSEDCGGSDIMLAYNFTCEPYNSTVPGVEDYYRGIFTHLLKRVPSLAWYWIWTPEGWEWSKVTAKDPAFVKSLDDLASAVSARNALNATWKMATNGWVVGPLPDRTIYDKELPKGDWDAIASIDMNTGHAPVDPSYANITNHAKWVIPWMEDDPDLSAPQLWVNRTLEHMEDAAT